MSGCKSGRAADKMTNMAKPLPLHLLVSAASLTRTIQVMMKDRSTPQYLRILLQDRGRAPGDVCN